MQLKKDDRTTRKIKEKKSLLLILILFILSTYQCLSQNYILFRVKEKYKISQHENRERFWVVPIDSNGISLSRMEFFVSYYRLDSSFIDCIGKMPCSLLKIHDCWDRAQSKSNRFYSVVDNLFRKHGRLFQKISIQSELKGQRKVIEVDALPIKSILIKVALDIESKDKLQYKNEIYFPFSKIEHSESFWNLALISSMKGLDFSKMEELQIPSNYFSSK